MSDGFPFGLAVAHGLVPNVVEVSKFGRNIEIDAGDTADIWDAGQQTGGTSLIWPAPTVAQTMMIYSSSTDDDDTGAGARTIQVWGLTDWDSKETSEVMTMVSGGFATNTTGTNHTLNQYVIIHRAKVLTWGTSINAGNIDIYGATDTEVKARIRALQGQTQMAIYGVPSVQTAYMTRLYANSNRSQSSGAVDINLLVNPSPDVEETQFITKHTFGLQSVGTSAISIPLDTPKTFPGPCIIKLQGTATVNDSDVSGGFDLFLVTKRE